jgi:long-subunit acyl-CoA synthetase (AMP-forming)
MMTVQTLRTPIDSLRHWATTTPDRVYMTQPHSDGSVADYTWAQVWNDARRVAAHLVALNLPRGSNIALYGRNSAHWIMADLAIWMAGHVSVPLYPTLSADAAKYILDHSEAKLLFLGKLDGKADSWNEVSRALPPGLPLIRLPMSPAVEAPAWSELLSRHEPIAAPVERDPDVLATIIYTSGTTGRPKGVMHSMRSISAPCLVTAELWGTRAEDRMLSYLPLAHIAERVALEVPSLIFGFRIFFNYSLETFPEDLQRARPTRFFSVPRLWTRFYLGVHQKIPAEQQEAMFADPQKGAAARKGILASLGLDAATIGFTGAAPLPAHIITWYRKLGLELIEVFGMTENAATSHACRPGDVRPGYVGTPLPGVECRLSEEGEVLVKSPGQMIGYYRMPGQMEAEMTPDGFFRTGDRGEMDETGRLRITGRVKELFKTSKGKYIAPVRIENQLALHPLIEVVCATGPGEPQPFALIMLPLDRHQQVRNTPQAREQLEQQFVALLDEVNGGLEDHERLDYLVIVKDQWTIESGMLTPTMKLRRNVIEDRYLDRAGAWRDTGKRVIWEE